MAVVWRPFVCICGPTHRAPHDPRPVAALVGGGGLYLRCLYLRCIHRRRVCRPKREYDRWRRSSPREGRHQVQVVRGETHDPRLPRHASSWPSEFTGATKSRSRSRSRASSRRAWHTAGAAALRGGGRGLSAGVVHQHGALRVRSDLWGARLRDAADAHGYFDRATHVAQSSTGRYVR